MVAVQANPAIQVGLVGCLSRCVVQQVLPQVVDRGRHQQRAASLAIQQVQGVAIHERPRCRPDIIEAGGVRLELEDVLADKAQEPEGLLREVLVPT